MKILSTHSTSSGLILNKVEGSRIFKKLGKKLIIGLLAILIIGAPPPVSAAWPDENWLYRVPIAITNSSGSNQTDFQTSFTLDTFKLITAGEILLS